METANDPSSTSQSPASAGPERSRFLKAIGFGQGGGESAAGNPESVETIHVETVSAAAKTPAFAWMAGDDTPPVTVEPIRETPGATISPAESAQSEAAGAPVTAEVLDAAPKWPWRSGNGSGGGESDPIEGRSIRPNLLERPKIKPFAPLEVDESPELSESAEVSEAGDPVPHPDVAPTGEIDEEEGVALLADDGPDFLASEPDGISDDELLVDFDALVSPFSDSDELKTAADSPSLFDGRKSAPPAQTPTTRTSARDRETPPRVPTPNEKPVEVESAKEERPTVGDSSPMPAARAAIPAMPWLSPRKPTPQSGATTAAAAEIPVQDVPVPSPKAEAEAEVKPEVVSSGSPGGEKWSPLDLEPAQAPVGGALVEEAPLARGFGETLASLGQAAHSDESLAPLETPATKSAESTLPDQAASGVVNVACPDCGKGLSIRREHLGIAGQCVWCNVPIVASPSEADGGISVNVLPTSPESVSAETPEAAKAGGKKKAESPSPNPEASGVASASKTASEPKPAAAPAFDWQPPGLSKTTLAEKGPGQAAPVPAEEPSPSPAEAPSKPTGTFAWLNAVPTTPTMGSPSEAASGNSPKSLETASPQSEAESSPSIPPAWQPPGACSPLPGPAEPEVQEQPTVGETDPGSEETQVLLAAKSAEPSVQPRDSSRSGFPSGFGSVEKLSQFLGKTAETPDSPFGSGAFQIADSKPEEKDAAAPATPAGTEDGTDLASLAGAARAEVLTRSLWATDAPRPEKPALKADSAPTAQPATQTDETAPKPTHAASETAPEVETDPSESPKKAKKIKAPRQKTGRGRGKLVAVLFLLSTLISGGAAAYLYRGEIQSQVIPRIETWVTENPLISKWLGEAESEALPGVPTPAAADSASPSETNSTVPDEPRPDPVHSGQAAPAAAVPPSVPSTAPIPTERPENFFSEPLRIQD